MPDLNSRVVLITAKRVTSILASEMQIKRANLNLSLTIQLEGLCYK